MVCQTVYANLRLPRSLIPVGPVSFLCPTDIVKRKDAVLWSYWLLRCHFWSLKVLAVQMWKEAGKVKCRVQRSDLMGWVGEKAGRELRVDSGKRVGVEGVRI